MDQITKNEIYDKHASAHAKTAIFIWILVGLAWILFGPSDLSLTSLGGILFWIPGIFFASFASMPLFLIRNKIALNVIEKGKESQKNILTIISFFDLVEIILAPIIYIELIERLL